MNGTKLCECSKCGSTRFVRIDKTNELTINKCLGCGCVVKTTIEGIIVGDFQNKKDCKVKSAVHSKFDSLWQSKGIDRFACYKWLADELKINIDDCHFSMFTNDQIKMVGVLVDKRLEVISKRIKKKTNNAYKKARKARKGNSNKGFCDE